MLNPAPADLRLGGRAAYRALTKCKQKVNIGHTLVPLAGFEPATYPCDGIALLQLSYRGTPYGGGDGIRTRVGCS